MNNINVWFLWPEFLWAECPVSGQAPRWLQEVMNVQPEETRETTNKTKLLTIASPLVIELEWSPHRCVMGKRLSVIHARHAACKFEFVSTPSPLTPGVALHSQPWHKTEQYLMRDISGKSLVNS